jgi:hypothetical protein
MAGTAPGKYLTQPKELRRSAPTMSASIESQLRRLAACAGPGCLATETVRTSHTPLQAGDGFSECALHAR